jgi:hypothetical protein
MKSKPLLTGVLILLGCILFFSCKKDPGEGGTSSITGKVFVKDYNSSFTVLQEQYYGPDTWVYIIYGDDQSYGDRVKTIYNGTYEFKYLRPGVYHVFAYSKDSTLQTAAEIAVIKEVEINKQYQHVDAPEITIFN